MVSEVPREEEIRVFDRFNDEEMTGAEYAQRRKHSFVIPDRLFDTDIDSIPFAVYTALSRHSDPLGYVRISDGFIVSRFKEGEISEEDVFESIKVLESKDFVIIHERDAGAGLYSMPDLMELNELNETDQREEGR